MVTRWRSTAEAERIPTRLLVAGAAVATVLSVAVAIFVLRAAPPHDRTAAALVHAIIVAMPTGVALAVLVRSPGDRFARALYASGVLWSATALAEASNPTLYSVGRVAAWLVEPSVVFLILAFPSGRPSGPAARRTVVAVVVLIAVLYVPTALVVQTYPEPAPWSVTCATDCPRNALAVTSSQPAVIDGLIRPLREVLSALILFVVAVIVVRRVTTAGVLLRLALIPVAALAIFRAAALAGYDLTRAIDREGADLAVVGWIYLLSLPLLALAFAAGIVLRRTHAALAIQRLALRVGSGASPSELRRALGETFEDPTLEILAHGPDGTGGWIDDAGAPAVLADDAPGRTAVVVRAGGGRAAALVLDEAADPDPAIVRAAATYALVVLENGRLVARLRASLLDLAHSRSRSIAIADETRRRIERDLHDGAQQRLIGLRIRLSMESEALAATDRRAADALAGLGDDVEHAIDDLRSLAHGIYPSVLTERGLPDALRAVARGAAIPTNVEVAGLGRYPTAVETTIYFTCVEALQNAEKHARGATRVTIAVRDDGAEGLVLLVADDGDGFDADGGTEGSGLVNLRDRLGAIGGSLSVSSAPGQGTCVRGTVPAAVVAR